MNVRQLTRDELGIGQAADSDRDVDVVLNEIDGAINQQEINCNALGERARNPGSIGASSIFPISTGALM